MPSLRAVAGPDGVDATVREVELGDPAEVSIEGLRVVISDDATPAPGLARAAQRAHPRRPGAARGRRRGGPGLAARGEDRDRSRT